MPGNPQGCSSKVHSCNHAASPGKVTSDSLTPCRLQWQGRSRAPGAVWYLPLGAPESRLKGKVICINSITSASLSCTSSVARGEVPWCSIKSDCHVKGGGTRYGKEGGPRWWASTLCQAHFAAILHVLSHQLTINPERWVFL